MGITMTTNTSERVTEAKDEEFSRNLNARRQMREQWGRDLVVNTEQTVGANMMQLFENEHALKGLLYPTSELIFYVRYFLREGTPAPAQSNMFAMPRN
jgi:hypothetical protein